MAAGEREAVTESKVVRRLVVSSIAWLDDLLGNCERMVLRSICPIQEDRNHGGEHRMEPQEPTNLASRIEQWNQSSVGASCWTVSKGLPKSSVSANSTSSVQPGLSSVVMVTPYVCSQSPLQCARYQPEAALADLPHAPEMSSNENKMSCRERGRAWQRVKGEWSRKSGSYGGSWSAPSDG